MKHRSHPRFNATPYFSAIWRLRTPATLGLLSPGLALAGPTGADVVGGNVNVTTPDATHTVINQSSQSAVVNWQQFNVNGNEYVIFQQPNSSAAILNRVIGGDPSTILGNITANGRVFIINPQGIIFGQGAKIDVGGLVASTLDIKNNDFMSGRYVFAGDSKAGVVNQGTITASDKGFVALVGDNVSNSGVIQANLGKVLLASGSAVTLDVDGNGLVNYQISEAALSERAGVENVGEIIAQGGAVIMSAKTAGELARTTVNNSGLIKAQGITTKGGDIYLTADGGSVENSGTLDASGKNGNDGGNIIARATGNIRHSGRIRVAGKNGGTARLVAEKNLTTTQDSVIDARAEDPATGNGGFVEVSGYESVHLDGDYLIGHGGTLLIDPTTLTIYGGSPGNSNITYYTSANTYGTNDSSYGNSIFETQIESWLYGGSNVVLAATESINVYGNFDGGINTTGVGNLTIGIGYADPTDGHFIGGGGVAGYGIDLGSGSPYNPLGFNLGGKLAIIGGYQYGGVNVGTITAKDILITAHDGIDVDGTLESTNGDVSLASVAGDIIVGSESAAFVTSSGSVSINGNTQPQYGGGSVTIGTVTAANDIVINAYGDISLYGAVSSTYGGISLASTTTAITGSEIQINAHGDVAIKGGLTSTDTDISVTSTNGGINLVGVYADATGDMALHANNGTLTITDSDATVGGDFIATAHDFDISSSHVWGVGSFSLTAMSGDTDQYSYITDSGFNVSGTALVSTDGVLDIEPGESSENRNLIQGSSVTLSAHEIDADTLDIVASDSTQISAGSISLNDVSINGGYSRPVNTDNSFSSFTIVERSPLTTAQVQLAADQITITGGSRIDADQLDIAATGNNYFNSYIQIGAYNDLNGATLNVTDNASLTAAYGHIDIYGSTLNVGSGSLNAGSITLQPVACSCSTHITSTGDLSITATDQAYYDFSESIVGDQTGVSISSAYINAGGKLTISSLTYGTGISDSSLLSDGDMTISGSYGGIYLEGNFIGGGHIDQPTDPAGQFVANSQVTLLAENDGGIEFVEGSNGSNILLAKAVVMKADQSIEAYDNDSSPLTVIADAISVQSIGIATDSNPPPHIDLSGAYLNIGSGTISGGLGSDPALLSKLSNTPSSASPNAAFAANGYVDFGQLNLTGDYLYVRANAYQDGTNVGGSNLDISGSLTHYYDPSKGPYAKDANGKYVLDTNGQRIPDNVVTSVLFYNAVSNNNANIVLYAIPNDSSHYDSATDTYYNGTSAQINYLAPPYSVTLALGSSSFTGNISVINDAPESYFSTPLGIVEPYVDPPFNFVFVTGGAITGTKNITIPGTVQILNPFATTQNAAVGESSRVISDTSKNDESTRRKKGTYDPNLGGQGEGGASRMIRIQAKPLDLGKSCT